MSSIQELIKNVHPSRVSYSDNGSLMIISENWSDIPHAVLDHYKLSDLNKSSEGHTLEQIKSFFKFLQGGYVDVTDETYPIFKDHGFINNLGYDLKFYSVRLHDRWIRDMMYPLKLYENDLYDLEELDLDAVRFMRYLLLEGPRGRRIVSYMKSGDIVIAGGACVSFMKDRRLKDIDIFFTCSEERAREILNDITDEGDIGSCWLTERATSVHSLNAQFIHRLYRSKSEVVHGFDLDSCGILFNGVKFYCTRRAKFSLDNNINYFDPDRSSPSYIHRLVKYSERGFRVEIPSINRSSVRLSLNGSEIVHSFLSSILRHSSNISCLDIIRTLKGTINREKGIVQLSHRSRDILDIKTDEYGPTLCHNTIRVLCERIKRISGIDLMENGLPSNSVLAKLIFFKYLGRSISSEDLLSMSDDSFILHLCAFINNETTESMDLDEKSMLLISFSQGINIIPQKAISTYDSNPITSLKDIKFNSQDPMTQVTTTWEPEIIADLREWLSDARAFTQSEHSSVENYDRFQILSTMNGLFKTRCDDGIELHPSVSSLFTECSRDDFNTLRDAPVYIVASLDIRDCVEQMRSHTITLKGLSEFLRMRSLENKVRDLLRDQLGVTLDHSSIGRMIRSEGRIVSINSTTGNSQDNKGKRSLRYLVKLLMDSAVIG
uniref:Uncharacterized protein n=1 Tax=viral metagenome TaxID=1070528 RepID=A0A6C0BP97_9ZZZZ